MNRNGMVLLEAIISIIIISISLTLIMQSFMSSYHSVALQKNYTQALIIIQNQLSKVFFDSKAIQSEEKETAPERFQYEGELSHSEEGMNKAVLNVQWPAEGKNRKVTVSTFVYEKNDEQEK